MSERKYLPDGSLNPRYNPAHHKSGPSGKSGRSGRSGKSGRHRSAFERGPQWLAWDGEGANVNGRHVYILLAHSEGGYIADPDGLSTKACLDFIAETARQYPKRTHVIFGGAYDANMWLGDVDFETAEHIWQHDDKYGAQVAGHRVTWRPRKSFLLSTPKDPPFVRTSQGWKPNRDTVTIWDVFGFFQAPFVDALEAWLGKDYPELSLIRGGKARRSDFAAEELESDILPYTQAELRALVKLMDALYQSLKGAGLTVRRWDGAGAIAAELLRTMGVKAAMGEQAAQIDRRLADAVQRAYFGARIETPQYGHHEGSVFHADLRSAYPSAMLDLPDLSRGQWIHDAGDGPMTDFSLALVRWDFSAGNRSEASEIERRQAELSIRAARRAYRKARRDLWGAIRQAGYIRPSRDFPDVPPSLIRHGAREGMDGMAATLGYPDDHTLMEEILRYRSPEPPRMTAYAPGEADTGCRIGPFPWRYEMAPNVFFPQAGLGWYWRPEVDAARAEASGRGYVFEVVERWSFLEETNARPFAWIEDLYTWRAKLKAEGNAAEKSLKLGINSVYGKLVQQVGYDPDTGRIPPYHQLMWGGYITSHTRAKLYAAAMQDEEAVVMFATDGIFATRDLDLEDGNRLGQWEIAHHDWLTVVQSGVYWHSDGSYSRGFDKPDSKQSALSREAVLDAWRSGQEEIRFSAVRFVGMGTALQSRGSFEKWRQWLDVGEWERRLGKKAPVGRSLSLTMAGTKRRDVYPRPCPADGLVPTWPNWTFSDECSAPYPLAWVEMESIDGASAREVVQEIEDSLI